MGVDSVNLLAEAGNKPHIFIFDDSRHLNMGAHLTGIIKEIKEPEKLQLLIAKHWDEDEIQSFIDFFTEALERHRKIGSGEKAEVVPIKND